MSLRIGDSLSDGFDRATNRNAGLLFVLFFFLTAVSSVVTNSAISVVYSRLVELVGRVSEEPLPAEAMGTSFPAPPIPMPLWAALGLGVVLWIAGETGRVISDRTFISQETEHLHEPTRWLGWATLSSFAFVVVFDSLLFFYILSVSVLGVLTPVLALFWALVGGIGMIVLSIFFFFTRQEIATKDVGPIEAMSGSWSLVRANEIKVFGLSIVLILIDIAHQAVFLVLVRVNQLLATGISLLTGAALLVFFSAVVAQAYRQLCSERKDSGSETTADSLDPNDEWNDPPL